MHEVKTVGLFSNEYLDSEDGKAMIVKELNVYRTKYDEYIQSQEWARRSEQANLRAGWRCQVCNSQNELHTHHRTYERLGAERNTDLTVLCADCHKLFHEYRRLQSE
mgnify:CR=1 FL=1